MEFSKLSCEEFIEALASKAPVPGGGGAAALVGAIGMALGNMVASLTLGKPRYADVQADILSLQAEATALQQELLKLIQWDAQVFEPLSRAYGLPTDTDAQREEKAHVMAAALKACCEVPLEIMQACCRAIDLHKSFAEKGAAIAISDVGCGVILCKAALQAASLNVSINTKSMANRPLAEEYNARAAHMLHTYTARADTIFAAVAARLQ